MKKNKSQGERNCSFCGKHEKEVKHLIAGQFSTYICGECIKQAVGILNSMETEEAKKERDEEKGNDKKLEDFLNWRNGVLLTDLNVSGEVLRLISNFDELRFHRIFPITVKDNQFIIAKDATSSEDDENVKKAINFLTGFSVKIVKVPGEHIETMLERYFPNYPPISRH